jgi:hypothetical protein
MTVTSNSSPAREPRKVQKLPIAKVEWWDVKSIYIRCPFCSKTHHHGFTGSYINETREQHCALPLSSSIHQYRIVFPFDKAADTVGYEIDKKNLRFVAIGAQLEPYGEDLARSLDKLNMDKEARNDRPKWEDASETEVIDTSDRTSPPPQEQFSVEEKITVRKIEYVENIMLADGNVEYVRKYLESSKESHIFLRGEDYTGETALIKAACKRYPDMVKLLLEKGADANAANSRGRTPLMEAALWGRLGNVEHLLEYGSNKSLRDDEGLRATDFAKPTERNEEERWRRSGKELRTFEESTYLANQYRKRIALMLEEDTATNESTTVCEAGYEDFEYHFFPESPQTLLIKLFAPIAEFSIRKGKTIARLERGGEFPSVSAKSGWCHDKNREIGVAGRDWMKDIFRLAVSVGHRLAADTRDQDHPGLFHSCHAEKQLIAYFISKHVFLTDETGYIDEETKRIHNLLRGKAQKTAEDEQKIHKERQEMSNWPLRALALEHPPISLTKATILASSLVCCDCQKFVELVNSCLGLDITILDKSVPRRISVTSVSQPAKSVRMAFADEEE